MPEAGATVTLRPLTESDAEALVRASGDPEVLRWTRIPENYRLRDAWAFIDHTRRSAKRGEEYVFAMLREGEFAGVVGVVVHVREPHRAEIGYWVAPWARRRGVARAGITSVLDWLSTETRITRVEALVILGNEASAKLLESLGFTREGIMIAGVDQRGVLRDATVFSILVRPRTAWRGS